jgi:hypothetical protein
LCSVFGSIGFPSSGSLLKNLPVRGIVVPCPQVVEAEVGVVLFAAVEVAVGRGPGLAQQIAVGIGDRAGGVGQLAHAAEAVVASRQGFELVGTFETLPVHSPTFIIEIEVLPL